MTERPNNPSALDRDDLIELIEDAMDRVHDMDVTFRQYAESVADALPPMYRAAPAMLEAMQEAVVFIECDPEAHDPSTDLFVWLRSANEIIHRATGGDDGE